MKAMHRTYRPSVYQLEDRLVPTIMGQISGMFQAAFSAGFSFQASAQYSSIFSSSTTTIQTSQSSTPTTTSSSITATLVNGVLTITGADANDRITLRTGQGTIEVRGTGQTFTASDVKEVIILANGGNDIIDLRAVRFAAGSAAPLVSIFGDAGIDTIFGSNWAEVIHGGLGADILQGNGGADQIFGDDGGDRLNGGIGDDFLDGGLGRDIVLGGAGADTLVAAIDSFIDRLDGGAGLDTFVPNLIAGLVSRDLTDVLRSLENDLTSLIASLLTTPPPTTSGASLDVILADLAARLAVPLDSIHVVSVATVTWPDTSLGCPEPGMMYAQVLVGGRRIVLEANGLTYEYHTDDAFTGRFVLCEHP